MHSLALMWFFRAFRLTQTLSGELGIYRAYYYCRKCGSSKVPLDEQLAFAGKHQSIGVRKCIALLGMVEGFEEASKRLKELTGVSVSGKEEQLYHFKEIMDHVIINSRR